MQDGLNIDSFGNKTWWKDNQVHRINGPAIEYTNGDKHWYLNDKRHREDGPAIQCMDGFQAWYYKGLLHRAIGPAIIFSNGFKQYWLNGNQMANSKHESILNYIILHTSPVRILEDGWCEYTITLGNKSNILIEARSAPESGYIIRRMSHTTTVCIFE